MSPDPSPNQPKNRSLSEISHLFLSSVREKQTGGSPRPQRTPPRSDESVDMTPEEFAQIYGAPEGAAEPQRRPVPVTALISAHLNGKQFDRVKQYARHLAGQFGRVGLIEVDGSEFRLMCFEPAAPDGICDAEQQACECAEPRQMSEALEELNWDVEQWLLLLPNPRTPEARALLREVDHWVLLSTCDHDGVVSSYRMLKGVAETSRPRLSLALLEAPDEPTASRVFQKLSGVCLQFLDWPVEAELPVEPAPSVNEHLVLLYRPTRDKAQLATAPQWAAVSDFLTAGRAAQNTPIEPADETEQTMYEPQMEQPRQWAADAMASGEPSTSEPQIPAPGDVLPVPMAPAAQSSAPAADGFDEVIDLPDHDTSGQSVLSAMLRSSGGGLVECPLRPPMCPEARLAVTRDRGIILLAVARQGLSQLRSIGQAYRWLCENQQLIRMALPQFAIDPEQSPMLRLLVDRSDLAADLLQPLMQADHVRVQAYRKLRWGERTGVFLEAA